MKHKKLVIAITGLIGVGMLNTPVARAGITITVDSTSDESQTGLITLREAIAFTNGFKDVEINFEPDVFREPQTITLQQGELHISSSVTINGPSKDLLTIDGDDSSRIFRIDNETDNLIGVEISGLTMTNGNGSSPADTRSGGCVLAFGDLTLNDSVVTACESTGSGGGVFLRFGFLTLNNSTIADNQAGNSGGGVYLRSAFADILNSTISGNTTDTNGGGVYIERFSKARIINSTISQNKVLLTQGGDIQSGGIGIKSESASLTAKNITVIDNLGSGITSKEKSRINISNSVIAGNTTTDCDFALIKSDSQNLNNLDTDGSCDVLATNHLTVGDPLLGPLADNGGLTKTHLPQAGSPLVDSGDDVLCEDLDQRGGVRPADGDTDGTTVCDIGAVELGGVIGLIFMDGFDN
ncbi:choice-of-anchor Q domain-containing protein [Marinicella sp. W31]|uniref:choice-of-anchor Q domain-containing protein n=1 Tax=Marinicella sp. W31 TaxID=3023713 RepID=UPI003756343D